MTIGIGALGVALPERVFTNDEWSRYVDTTDDWIRTRTGIEERRFAGDGETTASLALQAARAALEANRVTAGEVDEIIVATDTPEVFLPDTACFLQHGLGAREVPAYTLGGSGCAGFLQALEIARSRVSGSGRQVLVVGVELLSRIMNWADRNQCVLFGDAAAATLVREGGIVAELLATTTGTDGSQIDILKVEVGGTRSPATVERVAQGLHHHIEMNGREVFKHAVSRMVQASTEVCRLAGVDRGDIDLVVPHQANVRIINAVTRALEMPAEKIFVNVQRYGNTGSASVPLALYEAQAEGRIASGDLVLLTAFGAGFHWGATLLRYV